MIDKVPKQIERVWVLVALYNQVNGNINQPVDLKELVNLKLEINTTRLDPIYHYLKDQGLIRLYGMGYTCMITNEGVDIVHAQNKRTDKDLILDFLDYIDEEHLYYIEGYFQMVGIKSSMRIKHLHDILLDKALVDPATDPGHIMANYKGKLLNSQTYEELFAKKTPETTAHTVNQFNITGHGNVTNAAPNSTINATINIAIGNQADLSKALKDCGVEKNDIVELTSIMDEDKPTAKNEFGPKVNQWLGKIVTKCIEAGIGASIPLIATAIKTYYGL